MQRGGRTEIQTFEYKHFLQQPVQVTQDNYAEILFDNPRGKTLFTPRRSNTRSHVRHRPRGRGKYRGGKVGTHQAGYSADRQVTPVGYYTGEDRRNFEDKSRIAMHTYKIEGDPFVAREIAQGQPDGSSLLREDGGLVRGEGGGQQVEVQTNPIALGEENREERGTSKAFYQFRLATNDMSRFLAGALAKQKPTETSTLGLWPRDYYMQLRRFVYGDYAWKDDDSDMFDITVQDVDTKPGKKYISDPEVDVDASVWNKECTKYTTIIWTKNRTDDGEHRRTGIHPERDIKGDVYKRLCSTGFSQRGDFDYYEPFLYGKVKSGNQVISIRRHRFLARYVASKWLNKTTDQCIHVFEAGRGVRGHKFFADCDRRCALRFLIHICSTEAWEGGPELEADAYFRHVREVIDEVLEFFDQGAQLEEACGEYYRTIYS